MLIAPTLVSIFWMTTFGGTALHQLVAQGYTGVQEMVLANQPELSLFMMLRQLPWAGLTSLVAIVLVVIFFVTSSDSGSLVIDGITAGGKVDTPIIQRIFWAVAQGVVALILLLGGGLNSPAGRLGGHGLSIPVRAAPDDAVDLARAALVPSRRTPGGFPSPR